MSSCAGCIYICESHKAQVQPWPGFLRVFCSLDQPRLASENADHTPRAMCLQAAPRVASTATWKEMLVVFHVLPPAEGLPLLPTCLYTANLLCPFLGPISRPPWRRRHFATQGPGLATGKSKPQSSYNRHQPSLAHSFAHVAEKSLHVGSASNTAEHANSASIKNVQDRT